MTDCGQGEVLAELLQLLQLEKVEENIFRGQSQDLGYGAVFGGQVLGQALSAASQTVPDQRRAHSLHAYFMRPGDASRPIVYQVDCIRDGTSFTTRRVVAIQKGRAVFSMSASFQVAEPGYDHQDAMPPDLPPPEGLASDLEMARRVADRIPAGIRERILCRRPIEIRQVDPNNPFAPERRAPRRSVWFRVKGTLPEDPAVHRYLLAYASDFGLVATSLYPHGRSYWQPTMQVASLDHAMWFYRDFRINDWLLYAMESPSAAGARGLSFGRIFTRDGTLVAVIAQEGLIRDRSGDGPRR
ncbi:MAG: acyl-CoA thioesterase II [Desulfobacteraceae bacterium]|jgi:acyl-CoA thioesterase-2|nr:acyl-CoA thioesterase II [Desulfobacteraceae bacterium]